MPIKKTTTLPQFARLLAQPVTTVKRLFATGILPEKLVARPAGKHWRVSFSNEELQHCKASLALWSIWRRKLRASKTYARRDELNSTAIKLILAEARDEQDLKSPEAKIDAFYQALLVLNAKQKDVEGVWWIQQILAKPTELAVAVFILRTAVTEFRSKHARQPTRKQLAEALEISERSIYRFPFGKDALEVAYSDRNLIGINDGEKAESEVTDPRQDEYTRISRSDYARLHQRQIRYRDHIDEGTKRKLRKRKAHSFELAWEEHSVANVRGGALLIFLADKLQAKRRIEMDDQMHGGPDERDARRSREDRRDVILRERDATFGSWAVGAYIIQSDGKSRWWMNFGTRKGCADSTAQARREILRSITRAKIRLSIHNLDRMLADVGLQHSRTTGAFTR
jgi:hypothetical protein